MIEATCGACGAVARIAEADVPTGAKFVTCASCKARIALPQSAAGSARPPAIPIPKAPPIPSMSNKPTIDLADLPAPKRAGGIEAPKPSSRPMSGGADLPAPKGAKSPTPSALDLDDLMPEPSKPGFGLADLPAPKPRGSALGDAPASRPAAASALSDLPAPAKKPSPLADLPAPRAKPAALADLPAPAKKPNRDLGDLPAPAATKSGGSLDLELPAPASKKSGGSLDLELPAPASKKGGLDLGDLPAPAKRGDELPAPARGSAPKGGGLFDDLPAPRQGGALDLPAPKGSLELDDLPAPRGVLDLPTPKPGANNDLPALKPGANNDLPAPKGFFDDLPQPAMKPSGGSDLPAPKGFFDDLPTPAAATTEGGLFDDLPQPSRPAADGGGGFFDDLPNAEPLGGTADVGFNVNDIALSSDAANSSLELEGSGGPELDLGLPLGQAADFSELDLSAPSTKSSAAMPTEPGSPIKIKTPAKGAAPSAPIPIVVKKDSADVTLDLAEDPHEKQGGAAAVAAVGKGVKRPSNKPSPEEAAQAHARKRKRTRIALASVLGLALLGGGGAFLYKRHAAQQERADEIASQLGIARKQLGDPHPQHWQRASSAAQRVLEIDPNHGPALGLAAEAAIAGALDTGHNFQARVASGRKLAQQGLGAGKTGPELERAQAVMAIAANQPDRAITMLQKLSARSPKDGWLQLYLGWAQLAKGDGKAAAAAFSDAVAATPATKLPALYGHGKAKLLEADLEGARVAFTSVLETDKDHIGAQVGLAATLPPQQAAQREADLLAILQRPDIDKADPRAVVQAYTLAGDVARTTGRLDIARERYRKALALSALDLPALTGLAAVELRDGKPQVAGDLIQKALTADANDAEAQLVASELDIALGKLPDAEAKIEKLAERQPPLPPLARARLHVVKGRWLEAQGKDDEAVAEYAEGAKLAGEVDLAPTMAAVTKLAELAKKASDPAKAADYRGRADQLLSALAARAQEDGELSMTLGVAYLQAGDAHKAEEHLQRAVAMRDKDPESRLQLAKALVALGQIDAAIAQLKEAQSIDPKRGDIALELARTYQNTGRIRDAMAAYDKLLADPAVAVVTRANAGRFFAANGALDKAAAQAEEILKAEPENAAGLYLKGEGLILAGKLDEARITLTRATDIDQNEAQYLDALGRAFEGSLNASNDSKYVDSARLAYERATKLNPTMFHPHLGLGRMLVKGGNYDEAIKPLSAASQLDKSNSEVMYTMGLAFYGVRHQSPAHKKTAAQWLEAALKNQSALSLEQRADAYYRAGELYTDLNSGAAAAGALEQATRLGEEIEKQTGKTPPWLVDSFYKLGQLHYGLNNKPAQKRAWQRYVDRKPKPSAALTEANNALATYLK